MFEPAPTDGSCLIALDALFEALRAQGFTVVGPRVRSGAIVYDEPHVAADPAGGVDRRG